MTQPKVPLLDPEFLNPFIDGTLHTLRVQCGLDVTAQKFHVREPNSPNALQVDIAGIVGLAGEKFNGSIAICFPEKTFLGVMGKMLGESYDKISPEVEDGAGELMNIIYGAAKRVLNQKGYSLEKALPTVVSGSGLKVRHLSSLPTLVMPFSTSVGNFMIEVTLRID